jgi:hypothetical protein
LSARFAASNSNSFPHAKHFYVKTLAQSHQNFRLLQVSQNTSHLSKTKDIKDKGDNFIIKNICKIFDKNMAEGFP